jgi:hypothetical protein
VRTRSGKSSLLAALLGELDLVAGHALLPHHYGVRTQSPPGLPPCGAHHAGPSSSSSSSSSHPHPHELHHAQQQLQQQQQHWALVRRRIGYVSQAPWLLRGSVRDNVTLGQPCDAAYLGQVRAACVRTCMCKGVCSCVQGWLGAGSVAACMSHV